MIGIRDTISGRTSQLREPRNVPQAGDFNCYVISVLTSQKLSLTSKPQRAEMSYTCFRKIENKEEAFETK